MIRPATPADLPQLHRLICDLAAHHGDAATVTQDTLQRDLFAAAPWLHVLVAEGPQNLQGYTALTQLARLQYGQRGMDLHHLFVCAQARRAGLGKALLAASVALARANACSYLTVSALPGNAAAHGFYLAQGFKPAPISGLRFAVDLGLDDP